MTKRRSNQHENSKPQLLRQSQVKWTEIKVGWGVTTQILYIHNSKDGWARQFLPDFSHPLLIIPTFVCLSFT